MGFLPDDGGRLQPSKRSNITNAKFLDIIHRPVYISKQRFGDWILSPSSGKTY
jgi:hypothetical protein